MDVHSPEQRRYNMSRITGQNTKPEGIIRRLLWLNGYRYRLHRKDLAGKPDIVFPGKKKAMFVHGCFWHMHDCRFFKWPKTNSAFWRQKIEDNVARDNRNYELLTAAGWRYIVVWECETKVKELESLWLKIEQFISS